MSWVAANSFQRLILVTYILVVPAAFESKIRDCILTIFKIIRSVVYPKKFKFKAIVQLKPKP